eukprot:366500-Chlamydomonas_euryale.AAC.3
MPAQAHSHTKVRARHPHPSQSDESQVATLQVLGRPGGLAVAADALPATVHPTTLSKLHGWGGDGSASGAAPGVTSCFATLADGSDCVLTLRCVYSARLPEFQGRGRWVCAKGGHGCRVCAEGVRLPRVGSHTKSFVDTLTAWVVFNPCTMAFADPCIRLGHRPSQLSQRRVCRGKQQSCLAGPHMRSHMGTYCSLTPRPSASGRSTSPHHDAPL